MNILVIEDDRETAEHIVHTLSAAGHHVEEVHDGAAGIARARQGGHAALIVDRMLRGWMASAWCGNCAPRAAARRCFFSPP